jgi:hypothetical protein
MLFSTAGLGLSATVVPVTFVCPLSAMTRPMPTQASITNC